MKTLTYYGTPNFNEKEVTGRIVTWTKGQTQNVDDDVATKLISFSTNFVIATPDSSWFPDAPFSLDSNNKITSIKNPDGTDADISSGNTEVINLTSSRSLVSTDNGNTLFYAGASDIVLTVPAGLSSTFSAPIIQAGAGKVSTLAGSGVTFSNLGSTNGPNTFCVLQGTGTNTYSHQNPQQGAPVIASGIPFAMFSSWSFASNGALTLSVALPTAFPNAYVYFPANSITASNAAGWYYTTFSTTTAGQVFNNTYTSGTPVIPSSPTAFSASAGAVVAQVTTPVTAMNTNVIGGSLGLNGWIRAEAIFQANNSANTKACSVFYGNGSLFTGNASGANIYVEVNHRMGNCGVTNRQMARAATYNSFTGAPNYTSVDSTANQTFSVVMTLATAATGDYVIATGVSALLNYGA